jgi:hypothetical protein
MTQWQINLGETVVRQRTGEVLGTAVQVNVHEVFVKQITGRHAKFDRSGLISTRLLAVFVEVDEDEANAAAYRSR